MEDITKELAKKIMLAKHERTVWEAGRAASRAQGATALNPYSPTSSDYSIWADGYEAERGLKTAAVWFEDDKTRKP
ncbi:hypothetical protein [Aurantimonas sp. NFXS3]|uniref:hypothetical protein n=1 Tax=Aurantimonas sp. NFXS3 TaxID=2818434 RepID=UPI003B8D1373